jgi:TAT-translocated FGD2 family F420-dependent dehydrogenase
MPHPQSAPRVGFVLSHEQFPAPRLVEFGSSAERAGFDELWTSDHFHPWQDNQGHAGQAWVTLAALGQRTHAVPFGTGVTCPGLRYRPAIVAQTFASLGVFYPGRVFLGVGSGEALNEVAAGGGWASASERSARLAEAVKLIRKLWTGDWVSHAGPYYPLPNARIYDLPSQPVPIYIAGSGKHGAHLAGALGDGWITDLATVKNDTMRQAFAEGARSAGKDPGSLRVMVESFVVVGGEAEAEEAARMWRFLPIGFKEFIDEPDPRTIERGAEHKLSTSDVYAKWVVSDNPEAHADSLRELANLGATDVFVHSGQFDQERVIQFYGDSVLPLLRGGRVARAA